MDDKMNEALLEERECHFKKFNSQTALNIGNMIADYAINNDLPIGIEIFALGKEVFHFTSDRCIPDNDKWLKRKINTVLYFYRSTKFMYYKLNGDNTLLKTKYGLIEHDYSIVSGGFPIILDNVGVIGAIAVSGLLPEDDHQLIIRAIRQFKNGDVSQKAF